MGDQFCAPERAQLCGELDCPLPYQTIEFFRCFLGLLLLVTQTDVLLAGQPRPTHAKRFSEGGDSALKVAASVKAVEKTFLEADTQCGALASGAVPFSCGVWVAAGSCQFE
jgi:hypothetical protein